MSSDALAMDDTAKKPTSELFTVILCGPNFAVSLFSAKNYKIASSILKEASASI